MLKSTQLALNPKTMAINGKPVKTIRRVVFFAAATLILSACTQESQNKFGRSLQNWTGTDGVLEVYAGNQVVRRFMKIDKLSTATGTSRDVDRPYRFGYGIMDENLDGKIGEDEKEKVYFEFSDYSTPYVFFEKP